jgi:hypothetical protein
VQLDPIRAGNIIAGFGIVIPTYLVALTAEDLMAERGRAARSAAQAGCISPQTRRFYREVLWCRRPRTLARGMRLIGAWFLNLRSAPELGSASGVGAGDLSRLFMRRAGASTTASLTILP